MARKVYQSNRFSKLQQGQQVVRPEDEGDVTLVDISEVREQAKSFYEQYQKPILGIAIGVLVIFGGWFLYKNLYQQPRQKRAVEQMYLAERQFEKDSFDLALTNPGGGYSGFLDIISNFGGTPAANASRYYAGLCYLNLGQFDNAVKYLEDFSPEGDILPMSKYGALGDAYSELGKMDDALKNYKKAVSSGDNSLLTPYYMKKLGMFYEKQNKNEEAVKVYQELKDKYGRSAEGREMEKYILRCQAKLGK